MFIVADPRGNDSEVMPITCGLRWGGRVEKRREGERKKEKKERTEGSCHSVDDLV